MSPRLRAISLAAPVAALLVVGTAVPANATITVYSGGAVSGDADNDSINIACIGGEFQASGIVGAPAYGCVDLETVSVTPSEGSDTVNLTGITPALFPALKNVSVNTVDSPMAADNVTGSFFGEHLTADSHDSVNAGGGDDRIVGANSASGGAGDDFFMTIASLASGGEGDDRFYQVAPTGGLDGGPGTDAWELDFDQILQGEIGTTVALTISATGLVAEVTDVETQIVPASGLEELHVTLLRRGTQSFDGTQFPGTQHVRGMTGPDNITGGVAEDALYGGGGNDTVTGGPGSDILGGGDGNDTIQARDGVADRVDCGPGTDSVVGDAVDVIVNCETLDVPAAPAVVTPPAPPAQVVLVPFAPVTNAVTGPAKVKKGKAGSFTFSSPTAGATFQCQLDNGAWKSCASPYKVRTKKLKLGKHTLLVRALIGGAADATPSKKTFKVVRG